MLIDYKDFGKRVKNIRIKNGFTQADIAEKTNLTIRYISMIECGKANPTLEIFVNLINVLDTTPDYLLLGNTSKLKASFKKEMNGEVEEIIKNISDEEYRILIDMMKANKEAIRKATRTKNKKSSTT